MAAEETIASPRQGFFSLLAGALLHPAHTFELLREQGGKSWRWMALLAMLLTLLPVLAAAPISARKAQEALRAQIESRSGPSQSLTPEQIEQAEKITANPLLTVVFPVLAGLVGLWIGWLVWTGSLYLLSTMLGGSSSFSQMWQMVVWSWLPYMLRGLLQTGFILITGTLIEYPGLSGLISRGLEIEEIVAAPPSAGQLVLSSFLGRIDIYLVWNLLLLMTGVLVTARLSRRKAVLITLCVWAILTLLSLVPVLISGSLARGFSGL